MHLVKVTCAYCSKKFFREFGRINEAKKFSWKQYCSKECQRKSKIKEVEKICANCGEKVFRTPKELKKSRSGRVFCSQSCTAIFNNSLRKKMKTCPTCDKQFYGQRKYCSRLCCSNTLKSKIKVTKNQIIAEIKKFYQTKGRIPLKREFYHYKAARLRFGTWNKAIKAGGFKPNPVMFAKKFIAKDGHKCDSFAEKIIDDWLYLNNIKHQRNIPYPNSPYTADFLIKGKLVEFLGLNGELKKYDKNTKIKENLAKKHRLKLIEIFPKDLFPINRLSEIIKIRKA